jgi:outer membrane lipoprotein LolB
MSPARARSLRRCCAATLVAAALGACAHLPLGTDGLSFAQRQAQLASVPAWQMRGRLAVDTGDRAFQGSFQWQQTADALELAVRGPLGAGALRVAGTPAELTVTARGETRVLEEPERELSELVGWWLPISSLHSWLLGLPDPQFRATTVAGADGTLAAFEQRDWRLSFTQYQLAPQNEARHLPLLVPRRIDLEHGQLHLKLTIDDWRAPP